MSKKNHGFSFFTGDGWFKSKIAKDPEFAARIQAPAKRHQQKMLVTKLADRSKIFNPDFIRTTLS